jgi:archaellum component FlaC
MNISKAHWTTEGDTVRLSMPFAKVDEERRIVSGFATLDNVDKQGDIVTTEASIDAFQRFQGNLREMHQPIAIGKVLYFKEDRYFDPNTKKFYSGVYVSSYISKGAQDAWEKVLDKTYTGFSIGGNITKSMDDFDTTLNKSIRVIKEYDLYELSLVDNPANQFATILSVQKLADQGFLSKTEINNVYWCNRDDIVQISDGTDSNCPSCSKVMQNIGFVEKSDSENTDMIKFLVDSAKGISIAKMTKEEDPMTENREVPAEDETEEVAKAVTVEIEDESQDAETEVETEVETGAETMATITPETEAEKAVPVDESVAERNDAVGVTPENESDAEKMPQVVNVVHKADEDVLASVSELKESLNNAFGDLVATVKSIGDAVADLQKSLSGVTGDVANVTKQVSAVADEVATVKGAYNEFGKRVDAVEQDTAFRKSGDLGEIIQEQPFEKVATSIWDGRFLKTSDLFN